MYAKANMGQTLNYPPQCCFGQKLRAADFEERVCKSPSHTHPAPIRTWGKPEAVGLEQN